MSDDAGEQPLNFHQSTSLIGTSGQPTPTQFEQIAGDGYRVVINLAMPDSEDAIAEEGSLVAGLGMTYVNIPVPFDAPQHRHLESFIGIMETFKDQKVWVHCQVNARVSAFMYQYLTQVRQVSEEEATSPLLALWRPRMDDVWRDVLEWDVPR